MNSVEPDSVDFSGDNIYSGYYQAEDIDWLLRNIFNCSDTSIQKMREDSRNTPNDYVYYYDNGKYYKISADGGGGYYTFVVSAKYDGEFYYVAYDSYYDIDFPYPESYEGRHYAVLKLKEIDGKNYWSIYQWHKSPPMELDNISAYQYKKAADEKFWADYGRSPFDGYQYQEAAHILELGYDKTGDVSAKSTLDNLRDFLIHYGDDEYRYNYEFDYYSDYPYISPPTRIENLMGLPGFYVNAPPSTAGSYRDFYVISPSGKMTKVGSHNASGEGFIRDVDGDGMTELICVNVSTAPTVYVYRMKNGVVEEASLSYEDVDRLAPPDRQEGGNREGMSWYDGDTETFYLQYSVKWETNSDGGYDTEYSVIGFQDLSPFIFHEYSPNTG